MTKLTKSRQGLIDYIETPSEKANEDLARKRIRITPSNFTKVLKAMSQYFEENNPLLPVRAFYSILYGWDESSKVSISKRHTDTVTVSGEIVKGIIPGKREEFKKFVEDRCIYKDKGSSLDLYFSYFDRALDSVAPDFRIKHGIFFTDLNLSRFALWFVKNQLGDIGKNYLVIDPACGSGNLVTNWRSPLELRYKVVSEIEPELLYAVERRMMGDEWHNGKSTAILKVSEAKGLNFLDKSAEEYLDVLKTCLNEKSLKPDKPIAFLCNPPYRNDDDQSAETIKYKVHPSITKLTGNNASSERYCCFLSQVKQICEKAQSSGLPGESLLMLFTPGSWLTDRPVYKKIRSEIFEKFEDIGGFLINSKEFFNVKGKFSIAFTIWKFSDRKLDKTRVIELRDLTWLKNKDLKEIDWENENNFEKKCDSILRSQNAILVDFGASKQNIKAWSNQTSKDFKRDRRKSEIKLAVAGGLPKNDRREKNKKAYGEGNGNFIAFMDDLTPCKVKIETLDKPWFHLDNRFMRVRAARCFSGPPDNRGFCAINTKASEKLFFWFALARTFSTKGYPVWASPMEMWGVKLNQELKRISLAIGFAENECVETIFPANNPIPGTKQLYIKNPMSPNSKISFWSTELKNHFSKGNSKAHDLVNDVNKFYKLWKKYLGRKLFINVSYDANYFIGKGRLSCNSGIIQIRDYAEKKGINEILKSHEKVKNSLSELKNHFYELLINEKKVGYFSKNLKI